MSDPVSHPENGNGAHDPAGPKLGHADGLPQRGHQLEYAGRRVGTWGRSLRVWSRQMFSRDHLLSALKTLLWVVPLTVLIWVYAEREQQYSPPPVTIPIEITTNDPNRLVTLRRPEEPLVMARMTGPRSGVEAVIHSWDPNYGGGPVRVEIDRNLGVGDRRIDASIIGNDPRFANHGVTVSSCQPAWLDVVVDPIVEMPADVKAVNVPNNVGNVTFVPSTIKVRGPQRVLEEAAAAGKLHVEVDLAHQPELTNLVGNPSDHPVTLNDVHLRLPIENRSVAFVGSPIVQAEVSLNPEQSLTLDTVQVEVVSTNNVLDRFRVEFEPTLLNVVVEGPPDKLELLTRNDSTKFKPKATFEVLPSDIPVGPDGKTVEVDWKLPPRVHYKSGPRTVTYKLVDRPSGT